MKQQIVAGCIMIMVLTGCGQIGPLTLPPEPTQEQQDDSLSGKKADDRETSDSASDRTMG